MITDANRYYGCVISYLIDLSTIPLQINKISNNTAGFYLIQNEIPICIKYSTIRKGPWTFNFHKSHQETEHSMFLQYGECIVIFVCGKDGIAALHHNEFRFLLDEDFEKQESVVIRRKHNEMYSVSGKNGSLERKVSRKSLDDVFKISIKPFLKNPLLLDDASEIVRQPA